jgi:hypothetical protein
MHPDLIKEALLGTREYFNKHVGYYRATASMIAGLPTETIEQMHESNKWFVENFSDQLVIWQPLQIITHQGAIQAFGSNLSKYGYSLIDPASVEQYDRWREKTMFVKPSEMKDQVYWQNEHTNQFEVLELTAEWREKQVWGVSMFALWNYCTHFPLDEVMKIRMPGYEVYNYPPYVEKSKVMIEEYIFKKLNYEPSTQIYKSTIPDRKT